MPRVPSYDSFNVMPSGGTGARVVSTIDERDATAGGRQITAAGEETMRAGKILQDNIDEARAREADVALTQGTLALLHDKDSGYLNKEGKNAVDGLADANGGLEKLMQVAGQGLKTPRQQAMFERVAAARIGSARAQIGEHAARQTNKYNSDQAEAQSKGYADLAAAAPFDQANVAINLQLTKANAERIADLGGVAPEVREQAVLAATTSYHGAVLGSMMSLDRGTEARAYLAAHEADIDPASLSKFRATVKQAAIKSEGADLADTLIAEGGSLAAQSAKLREKYKAGDISVELRDEAQNRIEHQHGLNEQARTEHDRSVKESVNSFFASNPNAAFEDLPPVFRAEAGRMGFAGGARRIAGARGRGGVQDDPGVLNGLLNQAIDDPEGFKADFDPRDYVDQLSQKSINKLTGWARSGRGRSGGGGDDGGLKTFKKGVELMGGALAAAGIDTNPSIKDKVGATRYDQFQGAYLWALDDAATVKGSALTDTEVRAVGLSLLRDTALTGTPVLVGRNGGTCTYKTPTMRGSATEMLARGYDEIPPVMRASIIRDLQGRSNLGGLGGLTGQPSTDQVLTEYRRRVMQSR